MASCVGTVSSAALIDTTPTVGPRTFTVSASDYDENTSTATSTYRVVYDFRGFFSPIKNLPTINSANAGRTIPIKWRITDAQGRGISDPRSFISVTSIMSSCDGTGTQMTITDTAQAHGGLQYMGDGNWQYNWDTPGSYGTCRTMTLNLADGVVDGRTARFRFR